jgi:hypothetical protein
LLPVAVVVVAKVVVVVQAVTVKALALVYLPQLPIASQLAQAAQLTQMAAIQYLVLLPQQAVVKAALRQVQQQVATAVPVVVALLEVDQMQAAMVTPQLHRHRKVITAAPMRVIPQTTVAVVVVELPQLV